MSGEKQQTEKVIEVPVKIIEAILSNPGNKLVLGSLQEVFDKERAKELAKERP
jgi:hypothetical protein